MKDSIGYTVSLNIAIVFITVVFTFLASILVYYKSNKVNNIINSTIEKYEGYNDYAKSEITAKIASIGYSSRKVDCSKYYNKIDSELKDSNLNNGECFSNSLTGTKNEYCVFLCREKKNNEMYYFYKTGTNMMINIPIINNVLDVPIFSNTNLLYDFECQELDQDDC